MRCLRREDPRGSQREATLPPHAHGQRAHAQQHRANVAPTHGGAAKEERHTQQQQR